MRIRFLLLNAYAVGGTVRTVVNQANALAAAGHGVEIVSVRRHRAEPVFPLHPGIGLSALVDGTLETPPGAWGTPPGRAEMWQMRCPSLLVPRGEVKGDRFSLLTDRRLVGYLRSLDGGVLVTTRPALNLLSARFAPRGVVRVGQEHLHYGHHRPALRRRIDRWYRRLDAVTVLTAADRREYETHLAGSGVRVEQIPNPLPDAVPQRSPLDRPLILSAGRLVRSKGFDTLIRAFAPIAERYPDWRLRIYGAGPERDRLRRLIHRLHLYNHVHLMGLTPHLDAELAKASVFALASRHEGFGMVLAEAMSHGVPPVSFDCPNGPREIITAGDGLLVSPTGDTEALSKALGLLVERPDARRALGARARISARRYSTDRVRARWEALFEELGADTGADVDADADAATGPDVDAGADVDADTGGTACGAGSQG